MQFTHPVLGARVGSIGGEHAGNVGALDVLQRGLAQSHHRHQGGTGCGVLRGITFFTHVKVLPGSSTKNAKRKSVLTFGTLIGLHSSLDMSQMGLARYPDTFFERFRFLCPQNHHNKEKFELKSRVRNASDRKWILVSC